MFHTSVSIHVYDSEIEPQGLCMRAVGEPQTAEKQMLLLKVKWCHSF